MSEADKTRWFHEAEAAERAGDAAGAEAAYKEAIRLDADFAEARHNLAGVLRRAGRADEALPHAQAAARLLPGNAAVRHGLALALEGAGRTADALAAIEEAARLDPANGDVANNLGRMLVAARRNAEAAAALESAAARFPDHAAIHANLAHALLATGHPDGAADAADRALALSPDLAPALNARGAAKEVLGKTAAAIADFEAAIATAPDFAEAHENLALALLRAGRFAEGWAEYEWRWRNPANRLTPMPYASPPWDGGALAGRTLLLHAEQGLGDAIQFVRFAQGIAKDGGCLVVACAPQLQRLFANVAGIDEVCGLGDEPAGVDCHAPLMSLPRLLGVDAADYAQALPYVTPAGPSPIEIEDGVLNVGIAWQGSGIYADDPYRRRDCPPELFEALAETPGVRLVSFHKGPCPEAFLDAGAVCADFADDAAVLARLDLVISIDTALAHLAGAMGKPVWILLPRSADWRWMEAAETTIWYPSARLFRQSEAGDWETVFEAVKAALAPLAGQ